MSESFADFVASGVVRDVLAMFPEADRDEAAERLWSAGIDSSDAGRAPEPTSARESPTRETDRPVVALREPRRATARRSQRDDDGSAAYVAVKRLRDSRSPRARTR